MHSSATIRSSLAHGLDRIGRGLWLSLALVAFMLACGGKGEAEPAPRGESTAALSGEVPSASGIEKLPFEPSTLASLDGASVLARDALDEAASEGVDSCDADGGDPETLCGYWCNCVLTDEVNGYILRATVRCRGRAGCSPCCRAFWDAHM